MCTCSYKDALLGLRLRGGAGSNSENEHHITEFFKPVDRESEEYNQMQASERECMAAARQAANAKRLEQEAVKRKRARKSENKRKRRSPARKAEIRKQLAQAALPASMPISDEKLASTFAAAQATSSPCHLQVGPAADAETAAMLRRKRGRPPKASKNFQACAKHRCHSSLSLVERTTSSTTRRRLRSCITCLSTPQHARRSIK